jgi:hypothetical protein
MKIGYISSKTILKSPLALILRNRYMIKDVTIYSQVRDLFPDGHLVFRSTNEDIIADTVVDDSITRTAIEFEKSTFKIK